MSVRSCDSLRALRRKRGIDRIWTVINRSTDRRSNWDRDLYFTIRSFRTLIVSVGFPDGLIYAMRDYLGWSSFVEFRGLGLDRFLIKTHATRRA